jgi:hypothetical protein
VNSVLETTKAALPPENLHAFEPDAGRVRFFDQRMRLRLADSLRYILEQADGQLDLPQDQFLNFLSQLEHKPAAPLAFGFYNDTVLAIEEDNIEEASRLLRTLINLPPSPGGIIIKDLADPAQDAMALRYARFISDDPSVQFDVFPPSPKAAAACRVQIQQAFALMDAGDPELAAEIRALLREIILATGAKDPKALTFDGASSFMLWGGILLNADRSDGAIGMVQMLAHESAHNLLFGFSADESLVENPYDELFSSPLRLDPRPMDGIYHATFVTARMYRAVRRLIDSKILSGELLEKAHKDLAENARLFTKGIETVERHGKLSPLGKALIQGASEYMAAAA